MEVIYSMTIDDELILELIKPDRLGEVGDDALIIKVVGTRNMSYKLEEPTTELKSYTDMKEFDYARAHLITPDITVVISKEKEIAIELENDVHWDFGESLRQVKKYKYRFNGVTVIIPDECKRFAPLYKNEGFRVFLWKTKRRWQCLRCGTETVREGPVTPKCSNSKCKNNSQNEFRLVGLRDTDFEEYI